MDKQPTEARQDELGGMREKIEEYTTSWLAYYNHQEMFDGVVPMNTARLIAENSINDELRKQAKDLIDHILSLTVSSGGKCPKCVGHGFLYISYDNHPDCPACNGTGQKQPKTLGDIIKEAINKC